MTCKSNDSFDLLILVNLGSLGGLLQAKFLEAECNNGELGNGEYHQSLDRLIGLGLVDEAISSKGNTVGYRITADGINARKRMKWIIKQGKTGS